MGFIPLLYQGRLLGQFVLYYDLVHRFNSEESQVAQTIASHVAVAIERKRSEEALRASEERFSKAFHASPDPMCLNRMRDGVFIDVNEAVTQGSGYLREQIIGHTSDELGIWVNQQERDKIMRLLNRQRRIRNLETSFVTKSGDVRVILLSAETIEIDNEECLLTTSTDITDRKKVEEALRASEERFSKAFHASPDPMTISTLSEGRLIDVNESFLRSVRMRREDVIGRTAHEVGVWHNLDQRDEFVRRLTDQGHIRDVEVEIKRKSGKSRTFLFSGEIIEIGGRQCALITGNDITGRKRAEAERAELLAREQTAHAEAEAARREWQTTFDTMTDSVTLVDTEDRLIRANLAFYARTGLTPESAVGRPLKELVHARNGNIIDSSSCPACALRARGEHSLIELPAGVAARFPMAVTVDPVVDSNGKTVAIIQVVRDQSELYRAREEAERERITLNAAIEELAEGLMIFDQSPKPVRANERALNIFGFPLEVLTSVPSEALARSLYSDEEGSTIDVSDLPVQTAIRERRVIDRRMWYARPDGRKLLISVTASPFFNEQNQVAGAIALVRDITEQQREHERIQQADKLRALGQLSSGVAHNFNNALASIIGYTQLAMPRADNEEVGKYLQIVEQSARDAARMVERIQNFSRGGTTAEDFIPLQLIELVRDAIEMTLPRWRDDAEAIGIKYEVSLDWQASEALMIKGEPSELREVFVNIILNALDAMPEGGSIKISASAEDAKAAIKIIDTGLGMTEEIRRRIFEPFFTTKGVLGLGMGLSESYRIVERHGGRIEVESHFHRGTTFTVSLPLAQLRQKVMVEESGLPITSVRILIIDDEQNVRTVLAEVLSRQGHKVSEASNAEEGLRLADKQDFDVVFTDLAMPGIDGIAAATRIKSRHPSTKVVLMSGYGVEKVQELAGDTRLIDAAISKPFRLAELQRVLGNVMRNGGAETIESKS
jgi:PAS domain S-box-containing protein